MDSPNENCRSAQFNVGLIVFVSILLAGCWSGGGGSDDLVCHYNKPGCGPTLQWLNGIVWSGTQYVAVGGTNSGGTPPLGLVITSTDGIIKVSHTITSVPVPCPTELLDIAWNGMQFVSVGYCGTILTSSDGITWTARVSGTLLPLHGITWTGTQFVAVGGMPTSPIETNIILTSSDGVSWTTQTTTTTEVLYDVTWSGSQLVAVGDLGTLLTSPDGIVWTAQTSGTTNPLYGIASSGSQLVAVGFGGTILTSLDGIAWTARTSGTVVALHGVTWSGSQFVAVGDDFNQLPSTSSNTILSSPDGAVWSPRTSSIVGQLKAVAGSGSQFVIVGGGMTPFSAP